jgi:alpha-galactosidase
MDVRSGKISVVLGCFVIVLVSVELGYCARGLARAGEGQKVWLSSLDLAKMSVGWGEPVADKSIEKKPLALGGTTYEKGVGSHAPSVMYVELDGKVERFYAQVGVDTETGTRGSIQFRVYGEGKKLFDSGVMKGGDSAKVVDLRMKDVRQLILSVTAAGDGNSYDHADWADAFFTYTGKKPVAVDTPVEAKVILTPKPGPEPKINGPKVFGTRPGNPFIYRIPATGTRPMQFAAVNLPETMTLDSRTGIVTGAAPKKRGEYLITFKAENKSGRDQRAFKLVVGNTLALTPPMGWNSWYIHYHRVSDAGMRAAADAMIDSGMADFGYMYVNIDDCWSKKKGEEPYRDDFGRILPNEKFPDMKGLTTYIHSKGLRAGIYTSPGPWNCAGYVGSYQHEQIDAMTFAEWGFDFLKYDWCSYTPYAVDRSRYEFMKPYALMGQILQNLDRDVVYNLCQYGMDRVWEWGADVDGNCWRTTGDLGLSGGFMGIGLSNARHYTYAKPGRWNDPDYILIGWVGSARKMGEGVPVALSGNQQYQYMSMWTLMAAPLIFSGDMTKLDDFTLNVLCNAEVIEVDQDPLGKQGRIVTQTDDFFVMVKELSDGSRAVGLFNTCEVEMPVKVTWTELGVEGKQRVRDLWRQKELGGYDHEFARTVPRHGVELIRLRSQR